MVEGVITLADLPALCERAARLLETPSAKNLVCDVGAVQPDMVVVDALARLALIAQRSGARIVIRSASRELKDLVRFSGLCGVLPLDHCLIVEPERQTE